MQQIKQSDLDSGLLADTPISRLLAGNQFQGSWHSREASKALLKRGGIVFAVRHRHIGAWALVTQEALDSNESFIKPSRSSAFDAQEDLEEGSSESPRDSWWFAQ